VLKHRVIPALLLQNDGLVKTQRFRSPKYIGDPLNAVRIFNEKEVDELLVLDINASKSGAPPNFGLIEQLAGECFMPLCYGGGIRSLDDASRVFALGIEKVCLQTAVLNDLRIVSSIAERYGQQSVVVSVDVKRDWVGKPKLYAAATSKKLHLSWEQFIQDAVSVGAGEILLNAVDRDGTFTGPDLPLIKAASAGLPVPLISLGGVNSLDDIKAAVEAGATAVAAGAFFVLHGPHRAVLITYPNYRELEMLFAS
jgi:cyclase